MTQNRAVVIQASGSDTELAARALAKAQNLLREHPETPVEIVVQGEAVTGLVDRHPVARAIALKLSDLPTVTILACRNAMKAHAVAESTLAPGIGAVPAGIARLAERQWDGWAYIVI